MRYIRTKDGRISYLSREPYEDFDDYEIITSKGTLTYRREDEVIKQADTIEELCDEFVAVNESETPHLVSIYERDDKKYLFEFGYPTEYLIKDFLKTYKIYGAIWTDKGLIYVAKMNDKGELELL